jgi:NodT family efflux transporter outer membrane factor (OMF) lipoprotein
MRHRLLIAAVAALLSACAVGPSFEPPVAQLPEQWLSKPASAGDAQQEVDPDWWKQFGDPKLDELIETARKNNLDLRLAALRVAESRAQRSIATGGHWPTVNASAAYQRQRQSEFGVNTRLIDVINPASRDEIITALSEPFDVYQAGFDASWELDLWGRVHRQIESATAGVEAAHESFHEADLTVAAEVARTYFELLGTRDQLRIAREDVTAGSDQLELTRFRVKGGLVTDLDLNVQQAEVANTRAQIPLLEQQEVQLQNALALLLGAQPNALKDTLGAQAPLTALPNFATGVPSELARRRPDIREAEARLHTATAEIGVATADLYPRISLTGSFVHQSLEAADFGNWGARQWVVGPSLSLPIFQGGRLRSVVVLRELQQQEAAVAYQRTVLGAWHEIENSLSAYAAQRRRNDELANVLAASRSAYEIAHVRYEHGLTNYLVDLDAHRTLLQAQRAYSDSSTQMGVQLVSLCKALGGGWREAPAE